MIKITITFKWQQKKKRTFNFCKFKTLLQAVQNAFEVVMRSTDCMSETPGFKGTTNNKNLTKGK